MIVSVKYDFILCPQQNHFFIGRTEKTSDLVHLFGNGDLRAVTVCNYLRTRLTGLRR